MSLPKIIEYTKVDYDKKNNKTNQMAIENELLNSLNVINENVKQTLQSLELLNSLNVKVDINNENVKHTLQSLEFLNSLNVKVDIINENVKHTLQSLELLNSLNVKVDVINENILQSLAGFDKRIQDLEKANYNRIASCSAGFDECPELRTTSDEPFSINLINLEYEILNNRIQNLESTNLNSYNL
ncbi:6943_t:CDS:2 [Dentiscutata heterogama]|uniref:6943_t:CDS:1 n=1 Tax=Dentiscutata heterogama TaxID=1316150 RepID=A0ACA9KNV5_9GLOM|nr:6943_t:CDS:2 [Dentiscutata heterogama]